MFEQAANRLVREIAEGRYLEPGDRGMTVVGRAIATRLDVELDDDLKLLEAHRISDEVEDSLLQSYPGAEIIIHIDPVSVVANEPTPDFSASRDG